MKKEFPVQLPPWICEGYPPVPLAAVDYLRQEVDESMLREIAEADYAQDVAKHLAALEPIWKGGELRQLDHWFPMEVLKLIRWSEPEVSDWKPGSTGLRGHKMRAFSCAVLLATPNFEPDKETLIQLVNSVALLDPKAEEATAKFLAWRIEALGHEEDRPFFALALAAIIQSLEGSLCSSREQELADWVTSEESAERALQAEFHESYQNSPWMFGLSFNDMKNKQWKALIRTVQERSGEGPFGRMLAQKNKA